MENPTFHLTGIVRAHDEMQDFSGPLSLILMLLSKNKIEIRDLKIADILEQYLEQIAVLTEMNLDVASEFVQMASHLLYIKTRTLLASGEEVSELEELISSLEQLQCQEAYVSIKAVTDALSAALTHGALLFPKEPEPARTQGGNDYSYSHTPSEIFAALAAVLMREGRPQATDADILVPQRIVYNVRQKSLQLISLLKTGRAKTLKDLYAICADRSELVATFISVLELCAAGSLAIAERDGEMTVTLRGDGDIDIAESIVE